MLKNILIAVNVLALILVFYYLYFGFYHWVSHPPLFNTFEISNGFLFWLFCAVAAPVALAVQAKKPLWVLQPVIIIGVWCFWKTDFMQDTIFRNQPCSLAREMEVIERFIKNNTPELDSIVKAKEEELKLKSDVPLYYTDKPGKYSIKHASYQEDKVYHLYLRDIIPTIKGGLYHDVRLYYFPHGMREHEEVKEAAITEYNTRLFALDYDKFYRYNDKFIIVFEAISRPNSKSKKIAL